MVGHTRRYNFIQLSVCFLTRYSYYNSCFFKKDCSYRNNCGIWLHVADLEQSHERKKVDGYRFFFPFLFSGIPDVALGILKMLICICFHHVLQPAIQKFVSCLIWLSASFYSKFRVRTRNLNNKLNKRNQSLIKLFF